MKILTAVKYKYPSLLIPLSLSFWYAYWQGGKNISNTEIIYDILIQTGFMMDQVARIMEDVDHPQTTQALRLNTQKVIDRGAFGAPTFLATNSNSSTTELFFGSDRFDHIATFLQQPWPVTVDYNLPAKL